MSVYKVKFNTLKFCASSKHYTSKENFTIDMNRKDFLSSICKECKKKQIRKAMMKRYPYLHYSSDDNSSDEKEKKEDDDDDLYLRFD